MNSIWLRGGHRHKQRSVIVTVCTNSMTIKICSSTRSQPLANHFRASLSAKSTAFFVCNSFDGGRKQRHFHNSPIHNSADQQNRQINIYFPCKLHCVCLFCLLLSSVDHSFEVRTNKNAKTFGRFGLSKRNSRTMHVFNKSFPKLKITSTAWIECYVWPSVVSVHSDRVTSCSSDQWFVHQNYYN